MLPRYFTPRADPTPVPTPRGAMLAYLLDAFRLSAPRRAPREVGVVLDLAGVLHLVEEDVPASLPPALQGAFAHHELTLGRIRRIDAERLWLFDLELIEQPANTPGLNDPVYLYGRLYGPFPAGVPEPVTLEGQLSVTRADLLAGAVDEANSAFVVGGTMNRCHHLLLPADRDDAIGAGHGIVLAWPLVPAELHPADAGNEALLAQILYDVLAAFQADLRASGIDHALCRATLPVPSREDLARELVAKGYEVQGDVAIRRPDVAKKGLGALLTAVFGVPDSLRLTLPPEGRLPDYLELARLALTGFPGWPDGRARALRARVDAPPPPVSAPEPTLPRPSAPAPDAPAAQIVKKHRLPSGTPEWMDDFVRAHESPAHPPRLTSIRRPARESRSVKPTASAFPDWMKDFDE